MGRSLFGVLHRRFGRRPTGAERVRHARAFQEQLRTALPVVLFERERGVGGTGPTVAVIGAGLAGCCAAGALSRAGCTVTVYNPAPSSGQNNMPGGRVQSSSSIVPGRILEVGGELIGLNHPLWIYLADLFGFALGVVTPEDDYTGAALNMPMQLNGRIYTEIEAEALYDAMSGIFGEWTTSSSQITNTFFPWTTPNAGTLDSQSLGSQIPADTPEDVQLAIELEFALNNTVGINDQSWLANLTQFSAGQLGLLPQMDFFAYSEVYRSTAGNQALAQSLLGTISVTSGEVSKIDTGGGVTLTFADGTKAGSFDYVVVATSEDAWNSISVDGTSFPFSPVQRGPAAKYLAPVSSRFWLPTFRAPSSMSDVLGMSWEGTDNQAATAGFDLSVFTGGPLAQAAMSNAGDIDAYFASLSVPFTLATRRCKERSAPLSLRPLACSQATRALGSTR